MSPAKNSGTAEEVDIFLIYCLFGNPNLGFLSAACKLLQCHIKYTHGSWTKKEIHANPVIQVVPVLG